MKIETISQIEKVLAIAETATECSIIGSQLSEFMITDEETCEIRLIDDSLFSLAEKIRMKTEYMMSQGLID